MISHKKSPNLEIMHCVWLLSITCEDFRFGLEITCKEILYAGYQSWEKNNSK